jgi:hypothetical protein
VAVWQECLGDYNYTDKFRLKELPGYVGLPDTTGTRSTFTLLTPEKYIEIFTQSIMGVFMFARDHMLTADRRVACQRLPHCNRAFRGANLLASLDTCQQLSMYYNQAFRSANLLDSVDMPATVHVLIT